MINGNQSGIPVLKTGIFDLGNVFVNVKSRVAVERICRRYPRLSTVWINDFLHHSDPVRLYETGAIDSREFHRLVNRALKIDLNYEEFRSVWQEIFDPIETMIGLLPGLWEKYHLILLSNTNPLHVEYLRNTYRFLHYFHDHIFSYETRCKKPDAEIYRIALRRAGAKPAECVFIDDKMENVQGAHRLGIRSFQFRSPQSLIPAAPGQDPLSIYTLFQLAGPVENI
jgi:putative hydrolase of the HAD superfamily